MEALTARRVLGIALALAPLACPGGHSPALGPQAGGGAALCAGLGAESCHRARAIMASASAFSNVKHDYMLDPMSSFVPGRGITLSEGGTWTAIPTECAQTRRSVGTPRVDAATIDFGFVGVAVDNVLVAGDVDVTPFVSVGGSASVHKIKLVAVAFVRDEDPQFFDASENVSYSEEGCACGKATHFVGAVKMGGMLSYELEVLAGEAHGSAISFMKARIAGDATRVSETRVGGLEVEGLEAEALDDAPSRKMKPLTFHVKTPVPLAYAVYPIGDVCKLALPAPEVTPAPLDFGDVPYGKEATRLVHVLNRASIDLTATLGRRSFDVPARGSVDLPVTWIPRGDAAGCDVQVREESLVFTPKDARTPAVPKQQSVPLVENVRSGRGVILRAENVDTGEERAPNYAATVRDWTCPPDYVLAGCGAEHAHCSDDRHDCTQDFTLTAAVTAQNGCHFGCAGPRTYLTKSQCRFDAVMECHLRCPR